MDKFQEYSKLKMQGKNISQDDLSDIKCGKVVDPVPEPIHVEPDKIATPESPSTGFYDIADKYNKLWSEHQQCVKQNKKLEENFEAIKHQRDILMEDLKKMRSTWNGSDPDREPVSWTLYSIIIALLIFIAALLLWDSSMFSGKTTDDKGGIPLREQIKEVSLAKPRIKIKYITDKKQVNRLKKKLSNTRKALSKALKERDRWIDKSRVSLSSNQLYNLRLNAMILDKMFSDPLSPGEVRMVCTGDHLVSDCYSPEKWRNYVNNKNRLL